MSTEEPAARDNGAAGALIRIADLSSKAMRAHQEVAAAIRDEAYTRGLAEGRRQTYLDLIKADLRIADDLDALPDQRLSAEWHRTQAARFANRLRLLEAGVDPVSAEGHPDRATKDPS